MTDVALKLGDKEFTLRPTLKAARMVSTMQGGFAGAFQAIGRFELDAFVTIIAAGTGKKSADIEDDVFRAGVRNLVDPVARFVSILSNGGEDPDASAGTDEGGDADSGND